MMLDDNDTLPGIRHKYGTPQGSGATPWQTTVYVDRKWRTVRYAVSDIPTWARRDRLHLGGLTSLTRIHTASRSCSRGGTAMRTDSCVCRDVSFFFLFFRRRLRIRFRTENSEIDFSACICKISLSRFSLPFFDANVSNNFLFEL